MPALSTLIAGYKEKLAEVPRRVSVRMSDLVVTGTPYDSGSAQASWTPSIGTPVANNSVVVGGPRYPQRATVQAVARSLQLGQSFSLGNGLPYIRRLEWGYSGMAPAGMLRIAVAQHQAVTDEAVRSLA